MATLDELDRRVAALEKQLRNFSISQTVGALNVGTATGATAGDIAFSGALKSVKNATTYTGYIFVPLTTALTSTAWDGDARSTTAKTLIDMEAVFGVPAGIKAVLLDVAVRDSGSATGNAAVILGPDATAGAGTNTGCWGLANDAFTHTQPIVPCDANGDIYYQIVATGAGTLDAHIQIWGYFI